MLAECISVLTENINMQMEAEWADLFDRRLMSLYGIDGKNPTKMDIHGTEARSKHQSRLRKKGNSPTAANSSQKSLTKSDSDCSSSNSKNTKDAVFDDNLNVNISYLDKNPKKPSL